MKQRTPAVAYLRVSSKGQADGHGFTRQAEAIASFAKSAGFNIVGEYRDAHTGTEADRPEFERMLLDMLTNGCRTIIVESMDRFARDLMIQFRLLAELRNRGITLIAANTGEDVTDSDDPMREAMIAIQGTFAQLDKKLLVRKLAKARAAKRQETGRCEGRLPFGAHPGEADTLARILQMRRGARGRVRLSFAKIAAQLNSESIRTRSGGEWAAATIFGIVRANAPRLTSAA